MARACLATFDERLGDDEVAGALDRGREPLVERAVVLDRDGRARGQRLERRVEPALGQHRGMDPGRQLAQLLDRRAGVGERVVDRRAGRVGIGLPLPARGLEAEHERDEPLLRAVVEVARQAAALGVAGLDDAGARGAQRLELRAQLDLEPAVLERERGGAGGVAQQVGRLAQAAVVDQRPARAWPISVATRSPPGGGSASGRPSGSTWPPRSGSR